MRPTGTREHLASDGIEVAPVSDLTSVPPLVGGQVKTFHPAVYAGILARRDREEQLAELAEHGIGLIDLVVVNVKPFAPEVGRSHIGIDEAIEMIDVGGAALLGAAARNAAGVAAVVRSRALPDGARRAARRWARSSVELRYHLAADAFGVVAAYHAEIAAYLNQISGTAFPKRLAVVLEKVADLRLRREPAPARRLLPRDHPSVGLARRRDAAPGRSADVQQPARPRRRLPDRRATTRRRRWPSPSTPIRSAWRPTTSSWRPTARRSRPTRSPRSAASWASTASSTARPPARSRPTPTRPSIAPGYSEAALGLLAAKPGLELLAVPASPTDGMRDYGIANLDFKRVGGGLLVETLDAVDLDRSQLQVVTRRRPTLEELTDLLFAWRAVRHVRSNAIVLARNGATVGIGAAQASRQVSVEIALRRAGDRARLAVMASDAYFPFPDGIQIAAQAGVTAIIQPGGSIRDEMAIEVADRHHLAMVFTGRRHFRH